jgi:plastocyanin
MKKLLFPAGLVLTLAFVVAGCGKQVGTSTTPNTASACTNGQVQMATSTFVQQSCTIKAGDAVTFVDPAGTGNLHILCFGKDTTCQPNPDGPAGLNVSGGVTVMAGDPPKSYTFTKPGSYEVTCTVHPNMNVFITVQ